MDNLPIAVILGIAQDGGVPHPGCNCQTCSIYSSSGIQLSPTSLGVIDEEKLHLFDVSRDLSRQLRMLPDTEKKVTDIWITHGHLGHVDGIGLFGREAMGAKGIRIHASKSMINLIEKTPRWNTMIQNGNLIPCPFETGKIIETSNSISITPIQVPHRDEWTDTHSFIIKGPEKSILFLPDHDSWEDTLRMVGEETVLDWFQTLDANVILIDGTFWSSNEIKRQENVPHPPIIDSLERIGMKTNDSLDIRFIHLNHTNPLLISNSEENRVLEKYGWSIGNEGEQIYL